MKAAGTLVVAGRVRELDVLRGWLDSWPGIRWTAVAMHGEHHALRLERGRDGWIATFTYTGPTLLPPTRRQDSRWLRRPGAPCSSGRGRS